MKKLLLLFSAALTMLFVGCSQFDDTRIWDAIDELEDLFDDLDNRVEDLEEACEKMNTNIEALQTLVAALQANDTITAIAPIKQGDKIIGYTISFSKSEPITIYHGNDGKDGADGEDGKDGENGADGEDGYTPQIGIAKDSDNVYYWTLDGEWLLDENGNKIKAVGTDGKDGEDGEDGANGQDGADGEDGKDGENGADGKDGITPQLEIRDGYWYISYDNGATWKELGKATGEDGKDGADGEDGKDGEDGTNGADGQDGKDGDSLFQSVTWDEEYAYFTLSDGTVIKIPLASDSEAEEGDLPPANEIWYTSTDGEVVTPFYADEFGANIVSNTYEDGKGVITFDGDVTSIGYEAFYNCWCLASVTIPDSVTSIGQEAFAFCSSLASVSIGNGVTSIGDYAFRNCSLASVTIPDSVTSIAVFVFVGCESLAEFNGKFASSDGRCLIIDGVLNFFAPAGLTEYTIPDSVTSIGDAAFSGSEGLASVSIGNGVTEIGDSAFAFCSSLASITIPDSVTEIGDYAFAYCSSLTSVTIPNSVTEIGEGAFEYCSGLASVTIPDSVTSIGEGAFEYCSGLASVTIPDSVTSIGDGAFYSCESLAEFNGKVASSDGRCLIIDGVLNSFAPAGLTEYTIPDSVTSIGERAFYGCKSLTSITIPDSVTSIENFAFFDCTSLASIVIPDSVTSIGSDAFAYCSSLASVTIPDSVTSIGYEAFYNCSSLASVTIPDSVTQIGGYAFCDCTSLTSVYCKATTPPTGDYYMFSYFIYGEDMPIGCTIYVPTESVDAYKAAEGWSDYAKYIEPYNFGGGESNAGVKEVAAVSLCGFYGVGDNFYVILGYVSSGEDAGYNPPMDSWNYEFNIISDTEPVNDEIPLGTYTYVDYEKLASGEEELKTGIFTIAGAWDMWCAYVDANGEMQEYKYTEGTIVVSEGKIELTVTLENGEVHHVVYEGSLQTWGEAA